MDKMSSLISKNLKRVRKDKKLSLDAVAEMTGVSKSMLGQIERGESSPTIATLWKIATGLHISFTMLMETNEKGTEIISKDELRPLLSDEGRFRLYPFFPYDEEKKFEMMSIIMDVGATSASTPHEAGTAELFIVFEGEVCLTAGDETFLVKEGCGIRFDADKVHEYKNVGTTQAKMCMVIYYKK